MPDVTDHIQSVSEHLHLVALPQPLPGFHAFVSAWIYTGGPCLLVETGPSGSLPVLTGALDALGVRRLDAILLTHIHIDHAGGIGQLADRVPDTPVYCHPRGIDHLADPTRLWAGSLKTLGDRAVAYGPMTPVDRQRLHNALDMALPGVEAIETPGHAPHHISYRVNDYLFAGEACGVYQAVPGTAGYLRPATPPRFFLETFQASIDRLRQVPHGKMCFGHFGWVDDGRPFLDAHYRQLDLWHREIGRKQGEGGDAPAAEILLDHLLTVDPLLAAWDRLPAEMQDRERGFLLNSIRGFLGYLQDSVR